MTRQRRPTLPHDARPMLVYLMHRADIGTAWVVGDKILDIVEACQAVRSVRDTRHEFKIVPITKRVQ